jgi:sodium transport system ATP-binding protein
MIEIENLSKSFGSVKARDGVSFQAHNGRITGLLGPNGAGKTTTLRILYTVLKPDHGSARVDGLDVLRSPLEVRRRLGALPDSTGLYPRLTARENIRYYGRLHGLRGAALEDSIERLVKLLDMQDEIDRRTEGFSTGQRLKVAIGRALVHDPANVLLDEPTSGLDVISTRAMRDFIRRLKEEGKCVLFSSHIMQEVSALCNEIVLIARGVVAASGSPADLRRSTGKDNLEDAFVAAIGTEEGLE